ncbi:MAG: ribonuclease E inhibitor RraB [Rhizomicrobium sp.]
MIDEKELARACAADEDVLRNLRSHGDVETEVRPVDLRFVGRSERIRALQGKIEGQGIWIVIQIVPVSDEDIALDVQCDSTTESAAIRTLTKSALELSAEFAVEYDGWGTVIRRAH